MCVRSMSPETPPCTHMPAQAHSRGGQRGHPAYASTSAAHPQHPLATATSQRGAPGHSLTRACAAAQHGRRWLSALKPGPGHAAPLGSPLHGEVGRVCGVWTARDWGAEANTSAEARRLGRRGLMLARGEAEPAQSHVVVSRSLRFIRYAHSRCSIP